MEENETVPSDPATKIGAGSGRTTVELPPPLRFPNIGMGAFGFDQSGGAEIASVTSYDDEIRAENHQWKVTAATNQGVNVTGGVFRSQGDFDQADVPDVVELEVGASGYVILTVVRDIDSREVVEIPEISYVEGDLPESDYNNQIIPLAKVTFEDGVITNILQLKFEELHVFEDLVVVNGEFRFAELLMAGRKIYELPPP
jgi:hypothetical protein